MGPQIEPQQVDARLFISEYVNKAQIKLSKLEMLEDSQQPLVRCHKDENNYKDYSPLDFLAALTSQIPRRWEQTVRYLGHFSSRSRGKRRKLALLAEQNKADDELKNDPLIIIPPLPKKKASRSWVRLIRKVFEADPLVCKKCGGKLKVIAVIVTPKEATQICANSGIPDYRAPPPISAGIATQLSLTPLPHAA